MNEKTLAKRYAAALLKVTDAEGSTEETEQLLNSLKESFLSQKDFRAFLGQPRVPRRLKKQLLHKVFDGRTRKSFTDFLDLLIDKNRQNILPDIADMFDTLADASRGIVRVTVRSWRPLSAAQQGGLQSRLERVSGKRVTIESEVDPALKGGLLVLFGDTVIDGTVAHRLKAVGERFRELQKI
ncbi:MAG TPA: ATP synthase F1 subunit delta [Planctomycetota bacterium]|nr:ATP synthase F1 subunit delta [Planctomycetota bacterium]